MLGAVLGSQVRSQWTTDLGRLPTSFILMQQLVLFLPQKSNLETQIFHVTASLRWVSFKEQGADMNVDHTRRTLKTTWILFFLRWYRSRSQLCGLPVCSGGTFTQLRLWSTFLSTCTWLFIFSATLYLYSTSFLFELWFYIKKNTYLQAYKIQCIIKDWTSVSQPLWQKTVASLVSMASFG